MLSTRDGACATLGRGSSARRRRPARARARRSDRSARRIAPASPGPSAEALEVDPSPEACPNRRLRQAVRPTRERPLDVPRERRRVPRARRPRRARRPSNRRRLVRSRSTPRTGSGRRCMSIRAPGSNGPRARACRRGRCIVDSRRGRVEASREARARGVARRRARGVADRGELSCGEP
jgi:hypothetical protein